MSVHVLDNAPVVPGGGNQPVIPVSNLQQPEEIVVLKNVQPIASPSGGGDSLWEKINTYLRPIDVSNKVIIGNANSFVGGEILRVAGNIYSTNITVGTRYYLNGTTEYISQSAGELYFNSSIAGTHSLSDLAASMVTPQDILNWNEAFSWGDWSTQGFLTAETDPVFLASPAYGITNINITNWGTAYTNTHTHTNKTLLDSLISSGSGTNFLGDDGTYHLISTTVAGADTQLQYNNAGGFGANAAFTVNTASGTLNTTNLSVANTIYLGGIATYIDDIAGDLTFTDVNAGSVTLSALVAGATNFWTGITGGIYYGTGADKVGINTNLPNESLTVVGNIEADNFNSKYYRYNGNWLIGTNVGGSSLLRTGVIAFDNIDTATPLTLMDLSTRQIEFNGDVLLSSTKSLTVGNTTNTQYLQFNTSPSVPGVHTEGLVYWDSALGGLNMMSGVDGCIAQIPFENWVRVYNNTGSTLISGTAVYVTSASGDVVYVAPAQANSESTSLVTIGLATHDIPTGTYGNVTISGTVHDINTATLTEGGYVYLSPSVAGGLTSTRPTAPNTVAAIGICTVRDASVGSIFVNLRVQPTVERLSNVYISGVSDDDVLSWDTGTNRWTNRPVVSIPPSSDILYWDSGTNVYKPYTTQQAILSFDTSSTTPNLTTRLNINGNLYSTNLNTGLAQTTSVIATGAVTHPTITNGYMEMEMYNNGGTYVGRLFSYTGSVYKDLAIGDWNSGNPNIMLKVGGNVGFGVGTPTATMHIKAGTTSLAPLKLTAGTNLTTPEAGAVEFDGTHFYGTVGSTRYQLDQQGTPAITDNILQWDSINNRYQPYSTQQASLSFDTSATTPNLTTRLNLNGNLYSTGIYSYTGSFTNISGGVLNLTSTGGSAGTINSYGYNIICNFGGNSTITDNLLNISRTVGGTVNSTGNILQLTDNPTTSGTISGNLISGTIGTTQRLKFDPRVADGASAVASFEDTHNALSTTGAKLKSFRNQGTEKAYVDKDGGIGVGTDVYLPSTGKVYIGSPTADGSWRITINGTGLEFQRRESSTWVMKQTIEA